MARTETVKPDASPPGVVVIYTDKTGDVIATAADFIRQSVGGYSLLEGQTYRAVRALGWNVVRAYCSGEMADALGEYEVDCIMKRLRERGGKVTIVPVGHKDAA